MIFRRWWNPWLRTFFRRKPFEDLGFAKIDGHRGIRQGANEVIYGAGKTPGQIAGIVEAMRRSGQERILITRSVVTVNRSPKLLPITVLIQVFSSPDTTK